MAEEKTGNELERIIEIGWRRKWVILGMFLAIFTLVALWALYLPNLYQSSISIFYEKQKVSEGVIQPPVETDVENRLNTITQQISSRSKVLKVIKDLNLYPDAVEKGAPEDVLVEMMKKNISVEIPTRRGDNFYTINFLHASAEKAQLAVSELVSLFLKETTKSAEGDIEDTTGFLSSEVENLKLKLETQEKAVQEYKRKHMGELPDQLESNLRMLDNLQLQMTNNRENQRALEGQLTLLEQDISRIEGEMNVASKVSESDGTIIPTNLNKLLADREALRSKITSMQSVYTDRHPDLVAAKNELARLDKTIQLITTDLKKSGSSKVAPVLPQLGVYNQELSNLRRQVKEVKPRLYGLRQEEKDVRSRIQEYQRRVESTPMREQELMKLTRDYENTKTNYEELTKKKDTAEMAKRLIFLRKGESFEIYEPANYPQKPFLPKRPRIIAIGFVGGIGCGIGLALLLEALFPAFYSLKQLQQQTSGIPITFGILDMYSEKEQQLRWEKAVVAFFVTAGVATIFLLVIDKFLIDLGSMVKVIGTNVRGMLQ